MGDKTRLRSFSPNLMIAFGVLALFSVLPTGLNGQTSSPGETSNRVHQSSQEFSSGGSIVSKLLMLPALNTAAPAHGKPENARWNLRGLRVQVLLSDPMSGIVTGSGFWISTEGLVITCWRNVSSNPDGIIIIRSEATGTRIKGKLIAQDIHKNLALIQAVPNPFLERGGTSNSNSRLKAATPAPNLPQVGDKLFLAVKRARQTDFDVQAQPVSGIRPLKELGSELKILLSEVMRFGISGEPVVDGSGQLVGVLEGIYPSLDRAEWGSTEVVIPVQAILDLVKGAPVPSPRGK